MHVEVWSVRVQLLAQTTTLYHHLEGLLLVETYDIGRELLTTVMDVHELRR